ERMRITGTSNSGNVGIGTTNPGEKLEVVGNIISKGTSWNTNNTPQTSTWTGLAYGNGLFVAVNEDGANRIMTSPDGINWTARSAPVLASWEAIAYGNGLFVATADATSTYMTSPDGINWTARDSGISSTWRHITYGNGKFVATAPTGTKVMTSPDGLTRTAQSTPEFSAALAGITYGNGL